MGLLDQFSNLNEDQTQGLLAAAAQMLQQSGPSRTPTSFGQVLGGGMSAYQDSTIAARKRKLEEEQAKQVGQLRGLQIQEAQGGLADHDRARTQADMLRQFYMQQRLGQTPTAAPATAGAAPPMASAMPSGPDSPKVGGPDWMQTFQAGQPAPAAARAPQAQPSQSDPYSQRMALAQQLRGAGFHAEADAQEAAALKFKPKFANEPRTVRGPDGKPMLVQMADDGTVRPIEGGYGVAEKLNFQDQGGSIGGIDPYTGEIRTTLTKTTTPDGALNRAQAERHFNETNSGSDVPITGDAISNAAARYNIDGTLPPMGMGKAAAAGRSAILNKAAELAAASGISANDQRIAQIGNKANTAALSKIQQQQTMIGAFEKNFNMNADIALEYSAKVDRTGVPLANKWINAGKRSIAGDPDLSAYDQAIKSTVNEYAKIVSGSMGNTALAEGEIKKVEGLLNAAQTPAQVNAVINLMKRETQNRMKGFDEEKTSLRASMTGGQPAASATAAQASGKTVTLSDIAATAKASGRSTAEVTKALKDKGYTIGGM